MKRERVTVVVPTIGRPELLRSTLDSLQQCDPLPAEVLVVDQSDDLSSTALTDAAGSAVRTVPCRGRGRGLGLNEGLRSAAHPVVLITDDDCTVRPDWIAIANRAMAMDPEGIVSGQVLPGGPNPSLVPSTLELNEPRDYTGQVTHSVLFGGNMACPRDAVLAMGGFDERILPAAEDCDLCYRWLRLGRPLRHEPELVVYHHGWRLPAELNQHYVRYYHGQGMFYAKHLLGGDMAVLRFLALDYVGALRSLYSGIVRGVPRWADARRGTFAGLPRGLWAGWRGFRRFTLRRKLGPHGSASS